MPNLLYTYIYIRYIGFGLVGFYVISTIVGYLMPNPLYIYIYIYYIYIYILDFVWFGFVWFYGISTIVDYLMPNPLYTYCCGLLIRPVEEQLKQRVIG